MLDYLMVADQVEREAKRLVVDRSSWNLSSSKVWDFYNISLEICSFYAILCYLNLCLFMIVSIYILLKIILSKNKIFQKHLAKDFLFLCVMWCKFFSKDDLFFS